MITNKYYKIDDKLNKKIALMSDIHYSNVFDVKLFDEIIHNLKENRPNYICIPGDTIDHAKVLENKKLIEPFINFFKSISKIAPVIISVGNHDYKYTENENVIYVGSKSLKEHLSKIENIHIIDNNIFEIDGITFIGLTNSFKYYYNKKSEKLSLFLEEIKLNIYNKLNFSTYNILLCHSPFNILKEETIKTGSLDKINLILSGHAHNGMVPTKIDSLIKGNRGMINPQFHLFPNYSRGIVTKKINNKDITLIISGGINKISKKIPIISFLGKFIYKGNIEYIEL